MFVRGRGFFWGGISVLLPFFLKKTLNFALKNKFAFSMHFATNLPTFAEKGFHVEKKHYYCKFCGKFATI